MPQPRPRLADRIVNVDDVGHRGEDFLQLMRHRAPVGDDRAHRSRPAASPAPAGRAALRPRGRPCRRGNTTFFIRARKSSAISWLERLRSSLAARLRCSSPEFGQFAHVIMPHQTVEIERRRRAGIGFDRADFRQLPRYRADREQRALGVLQRRAFRQIDHHRQFRLVVERQQLDRDARVTNKRQTSTVATPTAIRNIQAERRERTTGVAKRR